jgi:hypothetical protein
MKAAIEGGDLAAKGVRTIGVNEALRRCAHLVKGFEPKTYGRPRRRPQWFRPRRPR